MICKLVTIYLLLQPILDALAGENIPGNIHLIVRGLFFIFMCFYLVKEKKDIKILLTVGILMMLYFTSYLFIYKYGITTTISCTLKLFYLPVIILFFYNYKDNINSKYLIIVFSTYIGLFLLSYILGIGNSVYEAGHDKVGFKGLFNSVNEFSAIIACLLPLVINYLQDKKKYILCILVAIITSIVAVLTGTKVLLGCIIITFLYFLYKPFTKYFKERKIIGKIGIILFMIIFSGLLTYIITNSTAYKNALVQKDFFKVDNILSLEGINIVIFNDRFSFIPDNQEKFNDSKIHEKLLGVHKDLIEKDVEIDFFDIFYKYGIIGLLLVIFTIIYYLYKVKLKGVYLLSYILLILISETSGHVLIYPAVCIYLGVIIYFYKEKKSNMS